MTCSICGGEMVWRNQLDLIGWLECIQCHGVNCEADEPIIAGRIGVDLAEADVFDTVWGPVEALWQEIGGEA